MLKELALLIMLIIGLVGISAVSFCVQPVKAEYSTDSTIVINADGSVTPADAPINSFDNTTYTMTDDINQTKPGTTGIFIPRSNIVLDGNGHTITGQGGTGIGIPWTGVGNVTIKNTTVTGFSISIFLDASSDNVIRDNNLSAQASTSVGVIGMTHANNNIFDGNRINANGGAGVAMYYYSSNNTFVDNYIFNCSWSIADTLGAGSGKFYHNIFMGPAINDGPDSIWDDGYPSGGNYWSGYVSPDLFSGPYQNITGGDGIGDNPYQVSYRTNIDHYPFMMVNICNVSQTPSRDNVTSTDIVEVNATITHYFPLGQVILNCTYTNTTATWVSIINMTNLEDDIWNGVIPTSPIGTNVTYMIIAQDNSGNSINSTTQGYTFDYPVVIPEFPIIMALPVLFAALFIALLFKRRHVLR